MINILDLIAYTIVGVIMLFVGVILVGGFLLMVAAISTVALAVIGAVSALFTK